MSYLHKISALVTMCTVAVVTMCTVAVVTVCTVAVATMCTWLWSPGVPWLWPPCVPWLWSPCLPRLWRVPRVCLGLSTSRYRWLPGSTSSSTSSPYTSSSPSSTMSSRPSSRIFTAAKTIVFPGRVAGSQRGRPLRGCTIRHTSTHRSLPGGITPHKHPSAHLTDA